LPDDKDGALSMIIRKIEDIFAAVGMAAIFLLMLLGTADVGGRYLFSKPILGATEYSRFMMMAAAVLGWAYTQASDSHIKVQILVSRFPTRARAVLNSTMLFITLAFFAIITWQSAVIGIGLLEQHAYIQIVHIPTGILYFLVSLGAFLMCIELIIQLYHSFFTIRKLISEHTVSS
jgi:TRAP-type C4-dicarboxylate transport system permease small subunit